MTEDALTTQNSAKMKWLGLESRRQAIQHEMIYLESALQSWRKHRTPLHRELCDEYEASIKTNLKQMKDVIVELRLNAIVVEQINTITRKAGQTMLQGLMEEEVYVHYSSGEPIENLPFDKKKTLHAKLKSVLDELI
jgi:hypothetical protein